MEISFQPFWIKNRRLMKKEELPGDFIETGASLYEVVRVIDKTPLFLEQHLKRLKDSARLTGLQLPLSADEIQTRLALLLERNQTEKGNIKIVINYPALNDPGDFYAYFVKPAYPGENDYQNGVRTTVVEVERLNPNIKLNHSHYRKTIDTAIAKRGVYEALLVDQQGNVSEGGRSNLFMINSATVYTAAEGKVLKGITRQMVLLVCRRLDYQVVEKEISLEAMLEMDALFLSGTSPKVLPISQVDDKHFASATHKIVRAIMAGYDATIEEYLERKRIGV